MNFTFLPVLAYNISRMRSAREYSRAPKNLLSFCFLRKSSRLTHHQTSQQYGHTLWLQLRICAFYYGPLSNVFVIFILFIKPRIFSIFIESLFIGCIKHQRTRDEALRYNLLRGFSRRIKSIWKYVITQFRTLVLDLIC